MTDTSIVIPVFNRAHLVRRAIDSSLAQTKPCEIVLVDHGSSDEIGRVVEEYKGRIRYIRRDEDRGPVEAWLDGVRHARGQYVHINYDDDWIQPTFIEESLKLFRPNVGFVYTRARIHTGPDDPGILSLIHPPGIRPVSWFIQYSLKSDLTVSPGSAVFRRKDILKNLLPQVPEASGQYGSGTGVGEDLLLFMLTTLDYPYYGHVARPLANFLAHEDSITVSAFKSDLSGDLKASYDIARQYYLRQKGAYSQLRGFRAVLARLRWELASGLLMRRVVNRLTN